MNRKNRKNILHKIASSLGIISSIVEDALDPNNKTEFKTLGTAGAGTAVMGTKKIIKDDGTLNVTVNFRGLAAHPKYVGHLKLDNGVLVTANAVAKTPEERKRNLGSALLTEQYDIGRVQAIIKNAMEKARQQQPDTEIKKVVVNFLGFSGGGSVVSRIVSAYEANKNVFKADVPVEIGAIAINDGWHNKSPSMIRFAEEARKNPDKHRLYITHTAVKTQGYPSTTETANYLLDSLGMKRKKYEGKPIAGLKPTHIAQDGGVTVLTAYDTPAKYYVDNRPGSMGDQHVQAARVGYIPIFEEINKLIKSDLIRLKIRLLKLLLLSLYFSYKILSKFL